MQRPPRPMGVTLAIIASLVLFSLFPLIEVGMIFLVRLHFANVSFGSDPTAPIAFGVDFLGIPDAKIALQTMAAIAFSVVAVFAWRGRPAYMRYVLMVACLGLTFYTILSLIVSELNRQAAPLTASSLDSVLNSLSVGQFALSLLVTLYVIWYLNRGPARAFYRGYYLTEPPGVTSMKNS